MEATWPCDKCKTWNERVLTFPLSPIHCKQCQAETLNKGGSAFTNGTTINQCAACGTEHLFRQRDFNRTLGIALLVLGVALAYWTYGISLLVVTIIDWLLYRMVGEVGCCYRCEAQYRNSKLVDEIPAFDLKLHDYYRSLKN